MLQLGPRELLLNMRLRPPVPHPWAGGEAFVVGLFDRARITLAAQQTRALNLVYALSAEGRLRPGSRTLILGAGPAGLTIAAAIARLRLGQVVILERGKPLGVFMPDGTPARGGRFVTPFMSEFPHAHWFSADANLPLMNWQAQMSAVVRDRLWEQFLTSVTGHPVRLVVRVRHHIIWDASSRTWLAGWDGEDNLPQPPSNLRSFAADNLILAVGFGDDARVGHDGGPRLLATPPYWAGLPQPPTSDVWIAGDGDGALADAISFARADRDSDAYEAALRHVNDWLLEVDRDSPELVDEFWQLERRVRTDALTNAELAAWYHRIGIGFSTQFEQLDKKLWPRRRESRVHLVVEGPHVLTKERFGVNRLLLWRALETSNVVSHLFPYGGTRPTVFDPGVHLPTQFHGYRRLGPNWPLENEFKDLKAAGAPLHERNQLDLTRYPAWPDGYFDSGLTQAVVGVERVELTSIDVEAELQVDEQANALATTTTHYRLTYSFKGDGSFLMEHRVSPGEPFRIRVTQRSAGVSVEPREEPWCVAYRVEGKKNEKHYVVVRGKPDGLVSMSDGVGFPVYANLKVDELKIKIRVSPGWMLESLRSRRTLIHRRGYLEVTGAGFEEERAIVSDVDGWLTTTFKSPEVGFFHQIAWTRIVQGTAGSIAKS